MIKQAEKFLDIAPIDVSGAEESAKEAVSILQTAKGVVISTNDQYVSAGEMLKTIKSFAKTIDEARKKITRPLDDAKANVMNLFRGPSDALAEAEKIVKNSMTAFYNKQEEIRLEQERKAQEAARKEEERKKKALDERANKAEANGDLEKAAELREKKEEVFVPRPVVASSMAKVGGVAMKDIWRFRIVNQSLIPREYLVINEPMLRTVAQATKGALSIPGVEFFAEKTVSASTR